MTQEKQQLLHNKFKIAFSGNNDLIRENINTLWHYFNDHEGVFKFKRIGLDKIEIETKEFVESWIQEYRNLWKGTLAGKIGDKNACISKMVDFFINTKFEYTKEQILQCANNYVLDTTQLKYLQQADYFIYKNTKGITSSRLLSYLESMEEEKSSQFVGDKMI